MIYSQAFSHFIIIWFHFWFRDEVTDKGSAHSVSLWVESCQAMKAVTRVPTFQFIVLQGLVGSLPWTALVFLTLWFELIGKLDTYDAHHFCLFDCILCVDTSNRCSFLPLPLEIHIHCGPFFVILWDWIGLISYHYVWRRYAWFIDLPLKLGNSATWIEKLHLVCLGGEMSQMRQGDGT